MRSSGTNELQWRKGIAALKKFKNHKGDLDVPRHHVEAGFRLGQWVSVQRAWYSAGRLLPTRRAQLNRLGFIWSAYDHWWEGGYRALKKFRKREGHCRVPTFHVEAGHKLGTWVTLQRRSKNQMSADRKRRLDKIGFVWRIYPVRRRRHTL